jgi:hypothetical protein
MRTKIILTQLVITALLFTSCQKDSDIFIPNGIAGGLDTNWVAAVTDLSPVSDVKRLLRKENVIDSVDATAGGTFQTAEGLTVIVLPGSLQLSNGTLATGKIHVETIIVKNREIW